MRSAIFDPAFKCPTHFAGGDPDCAACQAKQPPRCDHAVEVTRPPNLWYCELPAGHEGPHVSGHHHWHDVEEEPKPALPRRAHRFAVLVPMRGGEEIAPLPDSNIPGTYFARQDAVWALDKIGQGRIVHFVEVRDDEEVMPSEYRRLAAGYGDAWPRTVKREADERELLKAWDLACMATYLQRVDPPYETLRAFLRLLPKPEFPEWVDGQGGGRNPRSHQALCALMVAIRDDLLEPEGHPKASLNRPDFDSAQDGVSGGVE